MQHLQTTWASSSSLATATPFTLLNLPYQYIWERAADENPVAGNVTDLVTVEVKNGKRQEVGYRDTSSFKS